MELLNYAIDKCNFIASFLLKQTIYTCILFVFIFGISLLLKKKIPHWHFGLWMLILIRLLLPTDLNLSISARSVLDHIPIVNQVATSIDRIISIPADSTTSNIAPASKIFTAVFKQNNPIKATYKDKIFSRQVLFAFIWLTGCLLMMALVLKKLIKFQCIINKSTVIDDYKLLSFLRKWQHYLKIKRSIKIISSNEFLSPFTTGVLKPVIFIPQTILISTDTDTVHSIIAHELVHIKHFDVLWIKLQHILQIIYFFNPIVWYANRQIALAREQICDSAVLTSKIISPKIYGNSIVQILKYNLFGFDVAELLPGFGSHKKIYEKRIQNITKENAMKKQKTIFIVLTVCLIGFFVLPLAGRTDAVKNEYSEFENIENLKLFMRVQNTKETGNEKISENNEIKFIFPMEGNITSLFGLRYHPITGEKNFHSGIDIAAPQGTPIHASASGIVTEAGFKPDWGNLIVIQNNNRYSTAYGQCDEILVKEGQTVKSGDLIARCGRSGIATGNHLHFEIRKNREAIDPFEYLRGQNSSLDQDYNNLMNIKRVVLHWKFFEVSKNKK